MASYVVMERRPVTGSRPETVFVRDDFSVLALLFPLIWLLWYRLWFAALMLLLVSAGIGLAGEYLAPGAAMGFAGFVVALFVALEGPAWRMARYRRDGFKDTGTVIAASLEEAEIYWFAGHGEAETARTAPPAPQQPGFGRAAAEAQSDMLLGFAGENGR